MIAATFSRRSRRRLARLRARHDLHQEAADAHAGDVLRRHLKSGEQAVQHPVESVLRRRARAARRAEHGLAVKLADEQQVAGIDRHAEMLDLAAGRLDRSGDNVGLVDDRGGAEGDQDVRPLPAQPGQRLGQVLPMSCGTRTSSISDGAGALQPLLEDAPRLVHHRGLQPGQHGRREPDLQRPPGRDARSAAPQSLRPLATALSGMAKGMIFTVATMRPGFDRSEFRQGRDGQARIEAVQRDRSRHGRRRTVPPAPHRGCSGRCRLRRAGRSRPSSISATRRAASSSCTSPGSSRAATTVSHAAGAEPLDHARRRAARPSSPRRRHGGSNAPRWRPRPRRAEPDRTSCSSRRRSARPAGRAGAPR